MACGAIFHQCVYVLCERREATMQVGWWAHPPAAAVVGVDMRRWQSQLLPQEQCTSSLCMQRLLDSCAHVHARPAPLLCALQAGAAARAAYGLDPSSSYMPHMSLLYSDADEQQWQAASAGSAGAAAHVCALCAFGAS